MHFRFAASGRLVAAAVWIALLAVAASASAEQLRIVVWKQRHVMQLTRGDQVLRQYRVSLGYSPFGRKEIRGDGRTPVGIYYIYEKRPSDRFRWFLALNYPDRDDADRAFDAGRISADTWADIWLADKFHSQPPWNTPLGGFVGLHGTGGDRWKSRMRLVSDWTDGCVAVSDAAIDELYAIVPVGTEVEIRE
jgi:murein L,D-transpeptidase YafK